MLVRRGPLSKLIGGGIGFTQEYKADRAARKQGQQGQQGQQDQGEGQSGDQLVEPDLEADSDEDDNVDELANQLDAAQLELTPSNASDTISFDEGNFISNFVKAHPPPAYGPLPPENLLAMPVVIPQRRPGSKSRGFVRAYAALLQDAGIDDNTWLEFLKGFETSIDKNGWFHAMNAAVFVAGKVRTIAEGFSIIARFVPMAIHLCIEGGRRVFMNSKTNTYLDRMNEKFFKPRGLYAMLITYKPKSDEPGETIDVHANTVAQVAGRDAEHRKKWKNLLSSSAGKAGHEADVPDFAPLVFPQLDGMDEQQKQNAVKQFGSFMGEYMDRRGQAKFDAAHEDSKLANQHPEHDFASRYSDPNHPASQGGLVGTLSGGKVQYTGPLQRATDRRNKIRSNPGISRTAVNEGRTQRRNQRPMRKFLTPDALYLMVANDLSKEQQAEVLDELEEAKMAAKEADGGQTSLEFGMIRKTLGLQSLGRRK